MVTDDMNSIECYREAAGLLKGIETVDELKEKGDGFLDLMERAIMTSIADLKAVLEMPEEERGETMAGFQEEAQEQEQLEREIDSEMARLGQLPGGEEELNRMAEGMAQRLGPHMEEMTELIMKLMGGTMGDLMNALGGAIGELGAGMAEGMDGFNEPNYVCAECGYLTLKGDPCMSCGCETKVIKCNLCLAVLPDDGQPRCQDCLENANQCPHCHADLPPKLPEDCPHCGVPPKPQRTCTGCETVHYRDGDLCEDCQREADKPRCPECGEEKWSEDEYCHECYTEDYDGKIVKRVKCPQCGEKMTENDEECLACGGKLK